MHRSAPIKFALLLSLGEPAGAGIIELRQQLSQFAGENIAMDERLRVPNCASGYSLRWLDADRTAIAASCDAANWRVVLPIQHGATASRIRRGQLIRVETAGPGFRLSVDAVAEGQGMPGVAITMRNSASGRRFGAVAAPDGRMIVPGATENR
jgi:hypothetical protein